MTIEHTAFIGRTSQRERVWITIRLETQQRATESVTHTRLTHITRLSITGVGVWPHGRSVSSAGQIRDDVADVRDRAGSSWTAKDVRSLVAIWDQWHLNDMRAGCAHMTLPEDQSYDARKGIVCPETGYRYGRAWLAEELPADVIAELERLMALPTGNIPDYVR